MIVAVRADRDREHAILVPSGSFDLTHAAMAARAIESAEASLGGVYSVGLDLTQLDHIDGAGAVLLAGLLDRMDANGLHANVIEGSNSKETRLIKFYRERKAEHPAAKIQAISPLARVGAFATELPEKANTGRRKHRTEKHQPPPT